MSEPDQRSDAPASNDPTGSSGRPGLTPERIGRLSILAALSGILLSLAFPYPMGFLLGAVAAALEVTAIGLAIRALHLAESRGGRARGAIAGVVLGSVGLLLATLLLIARAVFGEQLQSYYDCLSGANTIQAQESCREDLRQGTPGFLDQLGGPQ